MKSPYILETPHVAAGLLEREGAFLLVASQYPNQPAPLWHLPGGRPRRGETLSKALIREFSEETSIVISVERLLYVSESFDDKGGLRILSATFTVLGQGEALLPEHDAHVVDIAWVPYEQALARITTRVLREPLEAHLRGDKRGYYAFADAGISITFADDP